MNQVRPNNLLALLSRTEDALLFASLSDFSAERHVVLQRAGEPTEFVYFPTAGMISFLSVMQNGEAVETAAVGYDNGAGFNTALSGKNANSQMIVQLAMQSRRISNELFRQAYEHSAGVRLMVHIGNEMLIEQTQQSAACHALHEAEQRLARWLLQSHDFAGQDTLDLTQDFVSEMIGVRRTTVSVLAMTLQGEGLIKYRRGHVTVVDREGLERRCCECYALVAKNRSPHNHPHLKPIAIPPQ
jgi:CRP-like cAMP-binding protein